MLERIANGRTDLVFEFLGEGHAVTSTTADGGSLLQWCAYYGDVSAVRFLLANGESLPSLGPDLGLNGAAFHGHWRLCEFLLEQGADANFRAPDTGETPLHSALSSNRAGQMQVVKVLLKFGADPNIKTVPGMETGAFMRDCRTRGETPLHRAAAFADEQTIQLMIDGGANVEVLDVNGDSPLTWGSWYHRPDSILKKLCYSRYRIRDGRLSMAEYLVGAPHDES